MLLLNKEAVSPAGRGPSGQERERSAASMSASPRQGPWKECTPHWRTSCATRAKSSCKGGRQGGGDKKKQSNESCTVQPGRSSAGACLAALMP
jgi:hypothetical protein